MSSFDPLKNRKSSHILNNSVYMLDGGLQRRGPKSVRVELFFHRSRISRFINKSLDSE